MQNVIDWQKIIGLTHNAMARDVERGKLDLIHGVGPVVRTETTLSLRPGVLIAKSIAEGSPWNTEELIATHKRELALIILTEVDSRIELMNKLHIKITIQLHYLDQVKLFTYLQSLSKISRVVPPMYKVNGPHLGDLVLVVLKDIRNNPCLKIIPEQRVGPTRIRWRSVWILKTNPLPVLNLPFAKRQRGTLLGCSRFCSTGGLGGSHHLLLTVTWLLAPTGSLPDMLGLRTGTRARATCTRTRRTQSNPAKMRGMYTRAEE
jgi:hypothetical protein